MINPFIEKTNDNLLTECAIRYGTNINKLKQLSSHRNVIYSYMKNFKWYILRITNIINRTPTQIEGEVEWINFLADNGVPVSKPILSKNGKWVELIEMNNTVYLAVSFQMAEGTVPPINNRDASLFKKMGQLTGKMHALAKMYEPSSKLIKRPEWYDSSLLSYIEMNIPKTEVVVYEKFHKIVNLLHDLSKNADSYGLIHGDIHFGNFNINNNNITYFDFDDCEYGWFIKDIVSQLFHTVLQPYNNMSKEQYAIYFMKNFWNEYNKQNILNSYWLKKIPIFLKLREIILYSILYNWREFNSCSSWVVDFMTDRKKRIEYEIPVIDIDFEFLNL